MTTCPYHPDVPRRDGRCPGCEAESQWVTWDAPPVRELAAPAREPEVVQPTPPTPTEPYTPYAPPPPERPRIGFGGYVLAMLGLPMVFGQSSHHTVPWATLAAAGLVALLGGAGLWVGDGWLVWEMAFTPGESSVLAVFTAPFAHFGVLHLLGNLWFLIAFGRVVEQEMTHSELGLLLITSAVLTTVLQALFTHPGVALGGASGAVAAVLGATLIHAPETRVAMSVGPAVAAAPMLVWGAVWFTTQSLGFAAGSPGIGWVAHLSGFVMGVGFAIAMNILGMMDAPAEP